MSAQFLALLISTSLSAGADEPRPLSLAEAVDLALRTDPLMFQARIAEDRSKLAVLRAQLDRVTFSVDGQLQEIYAVSNIGGPRTCTVGVSPNTQDACVAAGGQFVHAQQEGLGLLNLGANLTVPLFSGFKVEANVGHAERLENSSEASLRQERKDTALTVARAYWNVQKIAMLIEVQRSTLDRMRESEAVAAARVEAGLAPHINQNRAMSRRLQQEATLADLGGQLHEADAQLAVALGLSGDIVLTDQPQIPEAEPPTVAALLDEANQNRPELKVGALQIDAQREAVRMAKSGYYPQLSALALAQLGNDPFVTGVGSSEILSSTANPFTGTTLNVTLGVTLSMNFFDMFTTYTTTRDAQYEEERLVEDYRRLSRVVEADVRVAHAKVEHLYAQRTPLLKAREVARDNLEILQRRYKDGDALIIDLLDAQIDLAAAERQLADLTAQLQLAWLELDASLGKVVGTSS